MNKEKTQEELKMEYHNELCIANAKLDKIAEVCENEEDLVIEKIEGAYKNGRNSIRKEIESILKE